MINGKVGLCTVEDMSRIYDPLPEENMTDEDCQQVVRQVVKYFKRYLDETPVGTLQFFFSQRASNTMRRHGVKTVGDLAQLLARAKSKTGVPGAGGLVQQEWGSALRLHL